MFASRTHNENAIYEQQQAAAAKPLNQGSKTPANKPPKTPFGKTKNDENANLTLGKAAAKEGKAARNAFITPANPRTRAPLGNKTTNAKAFQTPAPLKVPDKGKESERPSSNKVTSPRLRRSKIKVHETVASDVNLLAQDPEEREIEYMPPRETPLPDYPDEIWPHDRDYSMLEGKNLTRGWWSEHARQEENSDDNEEPEHEDILKKVERLEEQEKQKRAKSSAPLANKSTNTKSLKAAPATLKSQKAASALATKSATSTFAAPTVNLKARRAPSATSKKPLFGSSNPRFAAAKAASNSTIGYSRGRVVSANRRPLADVYSKTKDSKSSTTVDKRTALDDLLSLDSLDVADDGIDTGLSGPKGVMDLFDDYDEPEVFHLEPVED